MRNPGINGHAARELGIAYPRVDYLGTDPLGFVISRNLARRHLSESQRAMVAAELAKMTHGGRRDQDQAPNLGLGGAQPAVSIQQAADMLNVGRGTVEAAKKVIRDGVPELAEAVRSGEIAVSAAAEIAKAPAEEQAAIVALPPDERVEVSIRLAYWRWKMSIPGQNKVADELLAEIAPILLRHGTHHLLQRLL